MRPKEMKRSPSDDMFRQRLENIIDMRHELVKLARTIKWEELHGELSWRHRIGKEGCEKILALTIQAGIETDVISKRDLKKLIVDTTVQEKNIAHPTDSALYLKALEKLVKISKPLGITLRQPYTRKAKALSVKISRYAHAGQFKRMRKSLKTLKGYLGRVLRDVKRKATRHDLMDEDLGHLLS